MKGKRDDGVRQARQVRLSVCYEHRCPVIGLADRDGTVIAEVHLDANEVEDFITQLREAATEALGKAPAGARMQ